ncbi:hypothetical protein DY000_02016285 [Brassica cretica]|uniref:Uncharacterized protein n=1 Tax=Brassica cretica TaxID=69181 RepID=A0ABQ7D8B5_BRACR|nr:hypothetical protein DY000_02016285 [Brassica cretica]
MSSFLVAYGDVVFTPSRAWRALVSSFLSSGSFDFMMMRIVHVLLLLFDFVKQLWQRLGDVFWVQHLPLVLRVRRAETWMELGAVQVVAELVNRIFDSEKYEEFPLSLVVHAQQYQKQHENSTAILTRSCKFGTFDPQGSALLIDRQQHLCVARLCSSTVDPDTSPVDRFSLTPVDRQHRPPSTDIIHPTSIDIPSRTSVDTEPRDMVAPLILVRDNNGDLHD